MSRKTRIEEITRKRSERNIILILGGIIFVLIVLFIYGIPILINFSLLIGKTKSNSSKNYAANTNYLPPPVIDQDVEATNSANITIYGNSNLGDKVKLYINGKFIDQEPILNDKSFSFRDVVMSQGNNEIKAKSITEDNIESEYSQSINIFFSDKNPYLDIISPSDHSTVSNRDQQIKIEGKTDIGNNITINDHQTVVDNQGNFTYFMNANKGENKIKVTASDNAGNTTSKEITAIFNQ